jgi:predicted AlkP superfamily pyrophosphatase or phosphodiesterase
LRRIQYLAATLFLLAAAGAALAAGSGGVNAPEQRDKPYLILVSIDGFRWDFQGLADTPALDQITASGIRAERMIPVFPTLTFPNHYSIATGLYPANHRLIGNKFPSKDRSRFYSLGNREAVQDGSWYGGQPVWVAAEKSGMVTAAYYFVGTEAPVDGVPMTYWHQFDATVPGIARVEKALDWLAMADDGRPHFITLYFEDVDTATHRYGPASDQSLASIERVDSYIAALMAGVNALPIADKVYVVIVSDHGQAARKLDASPFIMENVADLDGLTVIDHGAAAFIYLPDEDPDFAIAVRDAINESWQHGRAMLRRELPRSWRATEAAGFADIVAQAEPGYLVFSTLAQAKGASRGDHGWARESEDMHGIFMAAGPRLPKGETVPAIEAVDVYPLLMEILELPITTPIDGDPLLLRNYLSIR